MKRLVQFQIMHEVLLKTSVLYINNHSFRLFRKAI